MGTRKTQSSRKSSRCCSRITGSLCETRRPTWACNAALPEDQYAAFAAAFPFEETPDQLQAIEQVFADMTSDKPMDRVICGDVGFGKTEVALRAAFLAVQNGKQVLC